MARSKTSKGSTAGVSKERRNFLAGVVTTGAAVGLAGAAKAQGTEPPSPKSALPAPQLAAETGTPADLPALTTKKTGSDFMVDVFKTLDIDYMAALPGSTFRALQESFINYGGNAKPEWVTCLHEESSVAMAHGYAKVAGKPMAAMVHGTVGLQHASMALYNAYADRVPMLVITANGGDAAKRRPGVEWAHSVQDGAVLVRDFTKWDDSPGSLQHFAESTVRGYKLATSVPMAPVLLVADGDLQEDPLDEHEEKRLSIPKLAPVSQPQGDLAAVREAAKMLVAAESPVIVADRYARTPAGMGLLVKLAELVQAPVMDFRNRMNFPNRHPLCHSDRFGALMSQADFVLALEPVDLYGTLNRLRDQLERTTAPRTKAGVKVVSIGSGDLLIKANYQDFQRYSTADLAISGDAEATMPALIEAVQHELSDARKSQLADRGRKLGQIQNSLLERAREEAMVGWDASPISTARMCMELWAQIKNDDWCSVGGETFFHSNWPFRLWNFDKPHQHIGGSGAAGVGYYMPASIGAALANKDKGRLTVAIVGDGETMIAPGVLWTAAHHKIPLLILIQNNRAYHQEVMHLQRMANRHNRDITRAAIGTTIKDPNINYAKLADSMGVHGEGPVSDPNDLAPAIQRALAVVRSGEPALIDVVTQPR